MSEVPTFVDQSLRIIPVRPDGNIGLLLSLLVITLGWREREWEGKREGESEELERERQRETNGEKEVVTEGEGGSK